MGFRNKARKFVVDKYLCLRKKRDFSIGTERQDVKEYLSEKNRILGFTLSRQEKHETVCRK